MWIVTWHLTSRYLRKFQDSNRRYFYRQKYDLGIYLLLGIKLRYLYRKLLKKKSKFKGVLPLKKKR
uniref:Uncharacterized protein n=1 Tax=Cannabis sativa TaxID=3483 RepID=A0A803R2L9_CANSA